MVVTYLCKYNNSMSDYLTVNVIMLLFQSSMTQGYVTLESMESICELGSFMNHSVSKLYAW